MRGNAQAIADSRRRAALDCIQSTVKQLMDDYISSEQYNPEHRDIIDTHEIVVEILSERCVDIDLIDIPGLTSMGTHLRHRDTPRHAMDLAKRVIDEDRARSIFLMVVSSTTSITDSHAAQLIVEKNLQTQTIGVLTKLDMYHPDARRNVSKDAGIRTVLDQQAPLNLTKWFATCSVLPSDAPANEADIAPMQRLHMLESEEEAELRTNYPQLMLSDQGGVCQLRQHLVTMMEKFASVFWMEQIFNQLEAAACRQTMQNFNLGWPAPLPTAERAQQMHEIGESLRTNSRQLEQCMDPRLFSSSPVDGDVNVNVNVNMLKDMVLRRMDKLREDMSWMDVADSSAWHTLSEWRQKIDSINSEWRAPIATAVHLNRIRTAMADLQSLCRDMVSALSSALDAVGAQYVRAVIGSEETSQDVMMDTRDFSTLSACVNDDNIMKLWRFPKLVQRLNDDMSAARESCRMRFQQQAAGLVAEDKFIVTTKYDGAHRVELALTESTAQLCDRMIFMWYNEIRRMLSACLCPCSASASASASASIDSNSVIDVDIADLFHGERSSTAEKRVSILEALHDVNDALATAHELRSRYDNLFHPSVEEDAPNEFREISCPYDAARTAFNAIGTMHNQSHLHCNGQWVPRRGHSIAGEDYLQIALMSYASGAYLCGVSTRGRGDGYYTNQYFVKSYKLSISTDNGVSWMWLQDGRDFTANTDDSTIVTTSFPPIRCTHVRIYPMTWSNYICLRAGINVCYPKWM